MASSWTTPRVKHLFCIARNMANEFVVDNHCMKVNVTENEHQPHFQFTVCIRLKDAAPFDGDLLEDFVQKLHCCLCESSMGFV